MRIPEPARPFERFLLRWLGIPLAVIAAAVILQCSHDIASAARACEARCRNEGAARHVFVPGNELKGLPRSCTCVGD